LTINRFSVVFGCSDAVDSVAYQNWETQVMLEWQFGWRQLMNSSGMLCFENDERIETVRL
jgi:hypothetical protein